MSEERDVCWLKFLGYTSVRSQICGKLILLARFWRNCAITKTGQNKKRLDNYRDVFCLRITLG
ncbi:MAG: hypothetical protein A3C12_00790 [Candidatus Sungbacteria bacterium RIFCSPHIGHO2_02_FULL_49_20]|uniref:Uncharacterized protein n=1 Tax=Candidatus Sungbacteria bacterium RIFCSPHIGHO2_02_FULL_49_20 TaxID=1802272 RepID=A0A1G2KRE7_9BACT|nr:MAG: hypothetical protein A3C12_00790 [Candidatus Sungbacteria bacterium RIFCSPHIGHO2_02_FULL_49_20]